MRIGRKTLRLKKPYKMIALITVFITGILVCNHYYGIGYVNGNMTDTQKAIIIFSKQEKDYEKNDAVLLRVNDSLFIRRVIAVSGDVINIDNETQRIYVNGQQLDDNPTSTDPTGIYFPITVEENHVFVLNDEREQTTDSRLFGTVYIGEIVGKVKWRIQL